MTEIGGSRPPAAREVCEVVVTAPDAEWLAALTRRLVEDRLAACGHISTPIRAVYRWQGTVEDDPEARVALHTRRALVPRIVAHVKAHHPYAVPCVAALPIVDGNPDYTAWIIAETTDSD